MELLSSLTPVNAPSPVVLFKYALTQLLTMIKAVLLLYPVNLVIFVTVIFLVLRRITKRFARRPPFQAKYKPLPHEESGEDEARLVKKELRETQQQLVEYLKKIEQAPQTMEKVEPVQEPSGMSSELAAEVQSLLAEQRRKGEVLGLVEEQLRNVVRQTHSQISRLNAKQ